MEPIAVGFWGAFFGCAVLALVGSLLAFTRSARRVALMGSLAAFMSAAYALVFLGWVPGATGDILQRLQSATALASAAVLAVLLFLLLGTFSDPQSFRRSRLGIAAAALAAFAASCAVPAADALRLAISLAFLTAAGALVASAASARRGERAGWMTLVALPCVCVGMAVLDWHAFHPDRTPWPWHALAAVTGIAYLFCIAVAMWTRYSYLIEVSKVMTHGPNFDPVTSMTAYEAGNPLPELKGRAADGRTIGIIAVSISNLKLLEELHGRAAYNHALFVCATRLRRTAPPEAELGRLREDGFFLFFRRDPDPERLVETARQLLQRLARPVKLGTSREIQQLEESGAAWQASLGIGVLIESGPVDIEVSLAGARAMSRTAWGFASRMAWYDEVSSEIAELPALG